MNRAGVVSLLLDKAPAIAIRAGWIDSKNRRQTSASSSTVSSTLGVRPITSMKRSHEMGRNSHIYNKIVFSKKI